MTDVELLRQRYNRTVSTTLSDVEIMNLPWYNADMLRPFNDYIASIVDHRRPGNYRWLEQVYPGYVAERLPTAFVHYIRNAINAPLDLLSFLRDVIRAQFR